MEKNMKLEHLKNQENNLVSKTSLLIYNVLLSSKSSKNLEFMKDIEGFISKQLDNWRSNEDLIKIFQRLFKKYNVPGIVDKKWNILPVSDIDNKATLFLLKKYWFKTYNVRYSWKRSRKEERINFTNGREWLHIIWKETNGLSSFFNNSTISISDKEISNSYIIFSILDKLWAIPEDEKQILKNFVSFIYLAFKWRVDFMKSKWTEFYDKYAKTIYGISQFLPMEFIYDYISKWNTWFELLSDDYLNSTIVDTHKWPTYLQYFSNIKKNQINTSKEQVEDILDNKLTVKYYNQKIEFLVDIDWNLVNWLDIVSSMWKWLIKVNKNWTIMIYNPSWFSKKMNFLWVWQKDKIAFIEHNHKNYFDKIEQLVSLLWWKFAKYSLLKKVWYTWELLDDKKNNTSTSFEKEFKNMEKKRVKLRQKRIKNKEKTYNKQNFLLEDLQVWQKVYWKLLQITKKWKIFVDIWLQHIHDFEVYVTPTRLKWKEYYLNKVLKNKWIKNPEDKENILLAFKIQDIETDTSIHRIRLIQI